MQNPEPAYRQSLRETNAKMQAVAGRMHQLHISLSGTEIEGSIGTDWQPLEGVEGCETRLIPGAFIMEARYVAGAALPDVCVPHAVYVQVLRGRFHLQRLGVEAASVAYVPGQLIYLEPGERHAWRAETETTNIVAFVPVTP